jgi:hypothetical protein
MTKIIKKSGAIEIVRGGGCLGAFGIPFFVMGLILILSNHTAHHQEFHRNLFDTAIMDFFAIAMMVLGTGLLFGRTHALIQHNATAINQSVRLFFKLRTSSLPYSDIDVIRLHCEGGSEQEPDYTLTARSKGQNLLLLEHSDLAEIRQIAGDISLFTGAKLDCGEFGFEAESSTPAQYSYGNSSPNRISKLFFPGLLIIALLFVSSTADNWSWDRLQDFRNGVVYVEFPDPLFVYDEPGLYEYPLSFYQYTPSLWGNNQRQALALPAHQYQLSLQHLDSADDKAIALENNKVRILSSDYYLVKISIGDRPGSPYRVSHEFFPKAAQNTLLKPGNTSREWLSVPRQEVPTALREKSGILDGHFASVETQGVTDFDDVFYVNASNIYHTRGSPGPKYFSKFFKLAFGGIDPDRWSSPPMAISNGILHAHEGLVYSFGGTSLSNDGASVNWVYNPKLSQWRQLATTPREAGDRKSTSAQIAGVYSIAEKLFVMVRQHDYAIYQFDLELNTQWQLVKRFSLPGPPAIWQYHDENTLFSYRASTPDQPYGSQSTIGYVQLLDLDSYQVSTISTTPMLDYGREPGSILSPERPVLRLFSYEQQLYGYFSGEFYLFGEPR